MSKEELMAQWMDLAKKATREKPYIDETCTIAAQIAEIDPKALAPLLDIVADPASSPYMKILATLSLPAAVDTKMLDRIVELTKPGLDATTRACATQLLGYYAGTDTDAVVNQALAQLKNDSERRVRFQAIRVAAKRNDNDRKELHKLWKQPDTTPAEKSSILVTLVAGPITDSIWLLQEAAKDQTLNEMSRALAVQWLGKVGGPTSLPILKECAEKDPSENVRNTAKAAEKILEERKNRVPAPAPVKP